MKLSVEILGDLAEAMRRETQDAARGVTRGVAAASRGLRDDWRGLVRAAGLGSRLANTVRSRIYPGDRPSLNSAGMVWTNAPKIVGAHAEGVTIRARSGGFLAIPTEAAGARGARSPLSGRFEALTPARWEARTGLRLRLVYRTPGPSLLVADDARLSVRGVAAANRRRARRDGTRTGSVTVPIFLLYPRVQLRKRLDLATPADRWAGRMPGLIVANMARGR